MRFTTYGILIKNVNYKQELCSGTNYKSQLSLVRSRNMLKKQHRQKTQKNTLKTKRKKIIQSIFDPIYVNGGVGRVEWPLCSNYGYFMGKIMVTEYLNANINVSYITSYKELKYILNEMSLMGKFAILWDLLVLCAW